MVTSQEYDSLENKNYFKTLGKSSSIRIPAVEPKLAGGVEEGQWLLYAKQFRRYLIIWKSNGHSGWIQSISEGYKKEGCGLCCMCLGNIDENA